MTRNIRNGLRPMVSLRLAKFLMKKFEAFPALQEKSNGEYKEIFNHARYINGSPAERDAIAFISSEAKYKSELEYPWDHYFGIELAPLLQGKSALDLGCFTGGRGVAWAERYKLKYLIGVDVAQPFIDAAKQFAASKGVDADFKVAKGESLPVPNASVDAILSFDVLEHVQDLGKTLAECHRVLKPGGRLFVVFPSYYQPVEHHLSFVTRFPGIQYLFSGATLVRAYSEILDKRGADALWYKRQSPHLEPWERGNTINGTTLRSFNALIRELNWKVVHQSRKPIGHIGRNSSKNRIRMIMARLFCPLTYIPGLQEIFLHRITYILEKTK